MIVVMSPGATEAETERVLGEIRSRGLQAHLSRGEKYTVIGVVGNTADIDAEELGALPGVDRVVRVMKPYRLVHREARPEGTKVTLSCGGGTVTVGGREVVLAAGPCAVEDERSLLETARAVRQAGAVLLRGGAFKPRTSPYSFQGLGKEGLKILDRAREETGLAIRVEPAAQLVTQSGIEGGDLVVQTGKGGQRKTAGQRFSAARKLEVVHRNLFRHKGRMIQLRTLAVKAD